MGTNVAVWCGGCTAEVAGKSARQAGPGYEGSWAMLWQEHV